VPTSWVKFLFWIYLLFLAWAAGTVTNPADPDLWHRLATGEYLWHTGHFPQGDTFSYLSDYQRVADHEWGGGVLFYALWQGWGPSAIVLTKLVTLAVTLALVARAGIGGRRPTAWVMGFYALVLLTLLPSFQSTVRCMIFTHVFLALWVFWFQHERYGHAVATWWYVLTMIVWANLHGGFVVGLGWLVLVTVIEASQRRNWKKWALRLGLCSLATLINPFGWRLWISTARALTVSRTGITEWAPVSFGSQPLAYPGYKILFVAVIIALAIQIYRKGWRRLDRAALILIGAFMILSLTSARHTSLFAIVAGAFIPGIFPLKWPYDLRRRPLRRLAAVGMNFALVVVPLFAALIVLPQGAGLRLEYPPVACPMGAVDFLKSQDIRGKLLVPFNYGSYALWELRGKMRVSMDGRYDLVYLTETYRRVDGFFGARPGWHNLLTNPAPDAVLVPRDNAVYLKLRDEPGWKEAWGDSVDAVFLPR
jgi:hypothetical protein